MPPEPRPIKPLSDQMINRIAAGEVIERPASVLKELVENSLDAGARNIDISVAGGGVDLIEVRDDGYGVRGSEMTLALARHCTSKIASEHDLAAIASLGFRGEALASIAAVADVTLCSRTADEPHGWRIRSAAGDAPESPEPHAHPRGTRVEVRGLFRNTPARRRFLKRPQTEYRHIHQWVRRFGFCRPEVSFVLKQDGRRRLSLPRAGDERSAARRWRQLFGAGFATAALPLEADVAGIRISGWIGDAGLARNQTDLQFLAVNGRSIRDLQLARAIRLAFEGRLHPGKFPSYAVHVTLPAHAVDVNVHPGKTEVRFADLRQVHDLLYAAVRRVLDDNRLGEPRVSYDQAQSLPDARDVVGDERAGGPRHTGADRRPPKLQDRILDRVLAVVGQRFALFLERSELKVVDLRDWLRAVVTERLDSAATRGPVASRPLLIPQAMRLHAERLSESQGRQLAAWGIAVDELGPASVVIRTLPVVFPELDADRFGCALSEALSDGCEISTTALGRLAAEAANLPESETACADFLDRLRRTSSDAEVPVDDFCVTVDGDVLHKLVSGDLG